MLADCRHNTAEAAMGPVVLTLAQPAMVRYLRLTVTGNSKPEEGAHIWQVEAFSRPVPAALEGAVGSIDRRYDGDTVPVADGASAWSATAWRGERASGQFVIWSEGQRDELRAAVSALRGPQARWRCPTGRGADFFCAARDGGWSLHRRRARYFSPARHGCGHVPADLADDRRAARGRARAPHGDPDGPRGRRG